MSSIYPSLEDLKIHQLVIAQEDFYAKQNAKNETCAAAPISSSSYVSSAPSYSIEYPNGSIYPSAPSPTLSVKSAASAHQSLLPTAPPLTQAPTKDFRSLYPSLDIYMGLDVAHELINSIAAEDDAVVPQTQTEISPRSYVANSSIVAPLSSHHKGFQKAQVTNGIRELTLCKNERGMIGLRVCAISEGVFICLVESKSPAALVGLRFGDQILQINDESMAGYDMKQVHKILKHCPVNNIKLIVRDRPFERNVTLHKDSTGHFGFQFKNGQICRLVKDSSATRNGLLVDHYILEVNGQNVVGMNDRELKDVFEICDSSMTLTIMPTFVYEHMMKKMSFNLVKGKMDHSI